MILSVYIFFSLSERNFTNMIIFNHIFHTAHLPWTFTRTSKIKNLDNNIGSLKVKLTEEHLKEISDAVPIKEVAGGRSYQNKDHFLWKFAKVIWAMLSYNSIDAVIYHVMVCCKNLTQWLIFYHEEWKWNP